MQLLLNLLLIKETPVNALHIYAEAVELSPLICLSLEHLFGGGVLGQTRGALFKGRNPILYSG
jgi:hypothetical protein